jgi:outer membrane lipoprotein-sorting protein
MGGVEENLTISREQLPLPSGERVGVRGRACDAPATRLDSYNVSLSNKITSTQECPLTPTLSPEGRGSKNAVRGIFALLFMLLCCVSAHAQGTSQGLLHTVLNQLSQHAAVRASFTQQRQNPALTQPQTSSGQLLFVTDHGMLWQVQQPYQETLALTGTKTTRIDANGHTQPVRNERGVSQISQMLQSMLAGQLDAVMKQFNVSVDGTAAEWTLHFTPKQARVAQVLRGIELDGGAFLQGIHIAMQDGTQTDIRMTDTRDAGALSEPEKHALGLP